MKKVNIQFKFSNRFLYTFIVTVIMILVGVTVFAYTGNVGHTSSQIDESDPTVTSSVKDGVSWSELSGIPSGFADGTDNEGISGVSWSQISGIPSGFADGVDNEGSGDVTVISNIDEDFRFLKIVGCDGGNFNADCSVSCPSGYTKISEDRVGTSNWYIRFALCAPN